MTFYIAQIRQDFLCLLRHILQFSPQTRQKAGSDSARKLNYIRRHNENPAINPRDVESSGGSCVRGLGVLVPAKASL